LFDEPTSGLDPVTAKTVDAEIIKLRDLEHVTGIVVTHQLQDAFYIATHQALHLYGGFVIVPGSTDNCEEVEFTRAQRWTDLFRRVGGGPAIVGGSVSESISVSVGSTTCRMSGVVNITGLRS
jgi:ABC-type multidrug transport system ATPase subunit